MQCPTTIAHGADDSALPARQRVAPRLHHRWPMRSQPALCSFALVAVPLLAACGSSATSHWGLGGADSGGTWQGAGEGGDDSAGATTGDDGAALDAGAGGTTPEAGGSSDSVDSAAAGLPDAGAGDDSGKAGGGVADGPSEGGGVVVPALKAVMYLPNWNGSFSSWATQIDFNKMTHLLLAFGTADSSNNWDLGASDSDVQTLAAAAHANNVKILVSIGGADGDITIIDQYQTASNIGPLVSNLNSFVSRLNLDGVDVDLERGTLMTSSSNYPAFVAQLMSTFHPEGKLVTTALAQYIVQDAGQSATVISTVSTFDFINDMIYSTSFNDYTSEAGWWTGTIGLPSDKLALGIEFTNNLSVSMAQQITTYSKGYGGVMIWEYTQPTEAQLWPVIQGAL